MRIEFSFKSVFVVLIALVSVSCTGYAKLLKSTDHSKKFDKAIEYFEKEKYAKAASLLNDVTPYYSGTTKEDTIAYYLGSAMYKQGDFYGSGEIFDEFRRRYGRSPFIEDVEYMYAKGFYFSSPDANRDQTATMQAISTIDEYLNRYPNSVKKEALEANVEELMQKLYDKALINARVYYDIGYYKSAIVALENAIDAYPQSTHREELFFLVLSSHYKYATNSLESLQRERYLNMQDAYFSFLGEFPESKYRKDVDKMQEDAKKFLAKYNEDRETATAASAASTATPAPKAEVETTQMPDTQADSTVVVDAKALKMKEKEVKKAAVQEAKTLEANEKVVEKAAAKAAKQAAKANNKKREKSVNEKKAQ